MHESCMMLHIPRQQQRSLDPASAFVGCTSERMSCSLNSGAFTCSSSSATASATPGAGRDQRRGVDLTLDVLFLSSSMASTCMAARGRAHRSSRSRH